MRFGRVRTLAGLALGASLFFLIASPLIAAQQEITSAGPLTRIIISDTLSCQVAHRDDDAFEFYPSSSELGNCGTFLGLGGTVYGPEGGAPTLISWTPVDQTTVGGDGSVSNPLRIITTVDLPEARLRLVQTDGYVIGSESYRTDVQITNGGNARQTGILFRAGDCYLQGDDSGFVRVDNNAPSCIVDPQLGRRVEQWRPITPQSHFFAGPYGEVWSLVASQQNFPDTCSCDEEFTFDNGAGLSWTLDLEPGQSVTYSHETLFSPLGLTAVQDSFTDSVPGPGQISLDPLIIATSVAITAGVIVLVPFPSALFNNTLEENYDEVMGWIARLRARLARISAAIRARIRRWNDERRARAAMAPPPPGMPLPPPGYAPPPPPPGYPPPPPPSAAAPMSAPAAPSIAGPQPPPPPQAAPPPAPPPPQAAPPPAPPPPQAAPPPPTPPAAAAPPTQPLPGDLYAPLTATPDKDVWRTPLGMLGFIVLSSLLYGFLDPTFGLSLNSLATFLGLALGLLITLVAYGLPLVIFARSRGMSLTVRALPATLLIGIICVLISRLVSFQPGYLYGLIIGFIFAHSVPRDLEGRAEATAAAASLAAAFVAWMSLAFLRGSATGPEDFTAALLEAASVTIVVAGLENAVFAMLPLRFMPGSAVFNWNRVVWVVLIALGLFGFAHVLLNPSAGYLADTTRTSFFTLVALLAGFGLASLLFWAYFRFRPKRASPT